MASVTLKSGSDTATSATADLNDKIVFKYWVSAAAGTGASQVDGLNSIFKNSYTDSDCNSATYAELNARAANLALNLLDLGLKPLDRVVVQLPMHIT